MVLGDEATRLVDYGAQLLGVEGVRILGVVQPHQLEQQRGDAVDEPDEGVERHHQPLEHPGGRVGDLLGVHGRQGLGGNLPEHQHHQSQAEGGDGDPEIPEQPDADDGSDGGRQYVDQVVADEDQSQQAIRASQQLFYPAGGLVLGLGEMPQLVAVEGHQAGFGT
ncbi:hypothetical protein D3C79_887850 [compost metagenome]